MLCFSFIFIFLKKGKQTLGPINRIKCPKSPFGSTFTPSMVNSWQNLYWESKAKMGLAQSFWEIKQCGSKTFSSEKVVSKVWLVTSTTLLLREEASGSLRSLDSSSATIRSSGKASIKARLITAWVAKSATKLAFYFIGRCFGFR